MAILVSFHVGNDSSTRLLASRGYLINAVVHHLCSRGMYKFLQNTRSSSGMRLLNVDAPPSRFLEVLRRNGVSLAIMIDSPNCRSGVKVKLGRDWVSIPVILGGSAKKPSWPRCIRPSPATSTPTTPMEPPNLPADWVDLTFLGGLGEIGLNSLVVETADTLVLVDAGLMFPEDHMLGIDIVIPDFSYVLERRDKAAALILTHGHEDHIGAVPFLLKELSLPVVGTPFTLALVKEKLKEHGLLDQADLREIKPRETLVLGSLTFEFIAVSHSIVDGVGFAVHTPQGILVHSGDFKVDQTPVIGPATDLNRFAACGEAGVLALMSDSTNAERPGFTLSERQIGLTLEELIKEAPGRVIVAVFASHISRLQQIVSLAAKYGRKVLFNGKSMVVNSRLAKELGYLAVEADLEIAVGDLERLPRSRPLLSLPGARASP